MQILNTAVAAQADGPRAINTGAEANAAAASAATTGSGATGSSGTPTATVTANDFLTLLVAEMKNQDPTSNTDPNAYINQLVQVNSLQQLISINQKVGSLGSNSGSGSTTSASGAVVRAVTTASPAGSNIAAPSANAKQVAAQVAASGLDTSPAHAMTNFAAALRGEPASAPTMQQAMAASARRVASAL